MDFVLLYDLLTKDKYKIHHFVKISQLGQTLGNGHLRSFKRKHRYQNLVVFFFCFVFFCQDKGLMIMAVSEVMIFLNIDLISKTKISHEISLEL